MSLVQAKKEHLEREVGALRQKILEGQELMLRDRNCSLNLHTTLPKNRLSAKVIRQKRGDGHFDESFSIAIGSFSSLF